MNIKHKPLWYFVPTIELEAEQELKVLPELRVMPGHWSVTDQICELAGYLIK